MKSSTKIAGIFAGVIAATTVSASAALIDFTDNATGLTGSIGGETYEIKGFTATGTEIMINRNAGDTPACGVADINCVPLAADNDGLGLDDDEVTTLADGRAQYLTLTFSDKVKLTASYFLDLYKNPDGTEDEVALISVGAVPFSPEDASVAAVQNAGVGAGFGGTTGLSLVGTQFTFFVGLGNDAQGRADAALAAVQVSAVPLPAGLLLMGTALGGFGFMRRRKKA